MTVFQDDPDRIKVELNFNAEVSNVLIVNARALGDEELDCAVAFDMSGVSITGAVQWTYPTAEIFYFVNWRFVDTTTPRINLFLPLRCLLFSQSLYGIAASARCCWTSICGTLRDQIL